MPTPIPSGEKTAFLDIIKIGLPDQVNYMNTNLVNYEDIPLIVHQNIDYFIEFPQFLAIALNCFTNATMLSVGIYYKQTIVVPVTDTLLIVNSTFSDTITIDINLNFLDILNNSVIYDLIINNVNIVTLNVASGSSINILDPFSASGSITVLNIKNVRNNASTVSTLQFGSLVGLIQVDDGAFFGGYNEVNIELPCAIPVTGLGVTNITFNSMTIGWTNPVITGWLYATLYYRESNTTSWIQVDKTIGDFLSDNGFIFTQLQPSTFYDFQVIITCINGGQSVPIAISQQTTNI